MVGIASDTAVAEQIPYCSRWSLEVKTDPVDLTANGDSNKVYGSTAPKIGGKFSGFLDTATAALYQSSQDGLSRRFYLYPTTPDPATYGYWYGTAVFDFQTDADVGDAVKMDGKWAAQTFWAHSVAGAVSSGFDSGFDLGFF
jgi:hypothetical protein